jgi:hypothetical protein
MRRPTVISLTPRKFRPESGEAPFKPNQGVMRWAAKMAAMSSGVSSR